MGEKGLNERLDELKALIQDRDFLAGKGLSNEVNIRIFCYKPEEEMVVRDFVTRLDEKRDALKCRPMIFDLYQIFLQICEDRRILDRIAPLEERKGANFVLEQTKRVASPAEFVKKMRYEPRQSNDAILVVGVGEAFPFIRVHALLEAMQPVFSDVPIVVLYPGVYDGRSLKLFDKLTPNSYYRAFNTL